MERKTYNTQKNQKTIFTLIVVVMNENLFLLWRYKFFGSTIFHLFVMFFHSCSFYGYFKKLKKISHVDSIFGIFNSRFFLFPFTWVSQAFFFLLIFQNQIVLFFFMNIFIIKLRWSKYLYWRIYKQLDIKNLIDWL